MKNKSLQKFPKRDCLIHYQLHLKSSDIFIILSPLLKRQLACGNAQLWECTALDLVFIKASLNCILVHDVCFLL